MIITRTFADVNDHDLRALLHCAQYSIEQLTGRALHKSGPVPRPGPNVQASALRAYEVLKRESAR